MRHWPRPVVLEKEGERRARPCRGKTLAPVRAVLRAAFGDDASGRDGLAAGGAEARSGRQGGAAFGAVAGLARKGRRRAGNEIALGIVDAVHHEFRRPLRARTVDRGLAAEAQDAELGQNIEIGDVICVAFSRDEAASKKHKELMK